jgi:dipeptidyl aminopeptidase/acylaminoacyl peptidase
MIPQTVRKIALCLLLLASAPLWSTRGKAPSVSIADCIGMTTLVDPGYFVGLPSSGRTATFSPDGKRFTVVLRKGDLKRNLNVYSLLLFETDHPATPQDHLVLELTSSSNRDAISQIKWLSDNRTVAFVGNSGISLTQVFTYDPLHHRLRRITDHATSITSFDISGNAETTVFTAEEPLSQPNTATLPGRAIAPSEELYELLSGHKDRDAEGNVELYIKRRSRPEIPVRMTDKTFAEGDFRINVSPDGKHAVVPVWVMTLPKAWEGYEEKLLAFYVREKRPRFAPSRVLRYNLINTLTGEVRPLIDAPLSWSSRGIAWTSNQTVTVRDTYLPLDAFPSENDSRKKQTFDVEVNLNNGQIKTLHDDGSSEKQTPLDVHIEEDFQHPPKLVAIDRNTKAVTVLEDLNPQLSELQLGRVEELVWRDPGGEEIKGGLTYPSDYQPGQRYPLVIQTHGFNRNRFTLDGPWSSAFAAQPLAGKGFFVLQAAAWNPATSRKTISTPQEGPYQMENFEAAIAELDRRGLVDTSRVGIVGFSRSVFGVGYTLTHSKFKFGAAILADGFDGSYVQYLMYQRMRVEIEGLYGGTPYGPARDQWIKGAPGFNLDRVSAPVLLIALGSSSLLHNWEWYSGLSRAEKPVDLVYLPDAPHLLIKPSERAYAQQAVVDWFCFWLGSETSQNSITADEKARWLPLRSGISSN